MYCKNKNAWGLAKLAVKLNQGSYRLDSARTDDENAGIIYISKVLKDSAGFWDELQGFSGYEANSNRVKSAQMALNRAKFPDDKAMMYAAAYLSIAEIVPQVEVALANSNQPFPYWVAFDKHTEYGKWILQTAAERLNLNPYEVWRVTFYQAGVICNAFEKSPYFDILLDWRKKQMKDILPYWPQIEKEIINLLKDDVENLEKRLSSTTKPPENDQLSLFD